MSSNDNTIYNALPFNITSGGNVAIKVPNDQVKLGAIICASATVGTVTIYNGQSASGTLVISSYPLTAGATLNIPVQCQLGCFLVFSGAATGTILYV